MKVNGEAIYDTKTSPLPPLSWGRCTKKCKRGIRFLYLSVFDWPANGQLVVPGLKGDVVLAKLLADGKILKTSPGVDGLVISVPEKAIDPIATVIKVEIKGGTD